MKREILYFDEWVSLNEAKASKPKIKIILLELTSGSSLEVTIYIV